MDFNWKSPWVLGGGALLLFLLIAGKSGGSSNSASLGVASQNISTSANVQLAALSTQLQAEQDQTGAAVDIAGMQSQTSNLGLAFGYLSNIDSNNVQRATIDAGVKVNGDNNTTLLKLTSANNDTFAKIAPELASISASNAQALASIQAGEAETLATISQNGMLNRLNSSNNSQLLNTGISAAPGILGALGGLLGGL